MLCRSLWWLLIFALLSSLGPKHQREAACGKFSVLVVVVTCGCAARGVWCIGSGGGGGDGGSAGDFCRCCRYLCFDFETRPPTRLREKFLRSPDQHGSIDRPIFQPPKGAGFCALFICVPSAFTIPSRLCVAFHDVPAAGASPLATHRSRRCRMF